MNEILVIGSSNTDMVVKTEQLPLPGETKLGGTFFMNAGGKGANQAVAAARLGGRTTLVARLGNDIFGKQTLDGLKKENINTDYIFSDETHPSGTALIMVNGGGENCIVVAPGANAYLLPGDIEKVTTLPQAAILLVQLEIPLQTIRCVASLAAHHQLKLIINPAPAQKLDDDLLNGLFLITPNETEAFFLTGIEVRDEKSASDASLVFLKKGVKNVVITMGKAGAFFQNAEFKISTGAPAVNPVDTTAAGDVFNGALAVAITENMGWQQALLFAVNAATISVTRMGARSSIPYREEVF